VLPNGRIPRHTYICRLMEFLGKAYELIDTHCHLYLEELSADLNGYMERAEAEGVKALYMPSLDKDHFFRMLDVAAKFPGRCFAMAGLHPCYVNGNYKAELDFFEKELNNKKFAAIGEIGLDYYWDRSFDVQQMTCFREQIGIARRHNLPFVIHSRSSMDDVIKVLKEEKAKGARGIFHCFSGTYENACDIIDCGFLLGIGGVVTYKNSGLADVVSKVDLQHIVLETDAPYLAPVPYRGKRNESSYLKYILEKIAEVKEMALDEVAAITTLNATRMLGGASIQ
jgi:TatD DNase family protein